MKKKILKKYSGIDQLPSGTAAEQITEGCLVLEGGAFRGVYTNGVLDALMQHNLNFRTTIGVSAGSLTAMNYLSGQIGRSARMNLRYRHDSRYVGAKAIRNNQGLIGFDFLFGHLPFIPRMDWKRFRNPERELYAVVTNLETGKPEYLEKSIGDDFLTAVSASSSMPYISMPVMLRGTPYLDGGCSCKIPYEWALAQEFSKIIVVRTRPRQFRKKIRSDQENHKIRMPELFYKNYPNFVSSLLRSNEAYNAQCDALEILEQQGKIFVIAPSQNVTVSRLEKDMEKLGDLYYLGYRDANAQIADLKAYLEKS
ncbi:MAG: patatin family protein [Oscillospiraceae bacterium]|nr:patatin family protein [Oscillospiraceae bacterium]